MTEDHASATDGTELLPEQNQRTVRIVCTECTFSKVVTKRGEAAAKVIRDHGRETGHKLTAEEFDDRE